MGRSLRDRFAQQNKGKVAIAGKGLVSRTARTAQGKTYTYNEGLKRLGQQSEQKSAGSGVRRNTENSEPKRTVRGVSYENMGYNIAAGESGNAYDLVRAREDIARQKDKQGKVDWQTNAGAVPYEEQLARYYAKKQIEDEAKNKNSGIDKIQEQNKAQMEGGDIDSQLLAEISQKNALFMQEQARRNPEDTELAQKAKEATTIANERTNTVNEAREAAKRYAQNEEIKNKNTAQATQDKNMVDVLFSYKNMEGDARAAEYIDKGENKNTAQQKGEELGAQGLAIYNAAKDKGMTDSQALREATKIQNLNADYIKAGAAALTDNDAMLWAGMSDEYKKIYNYLLGKYGENSQEFKNFKNAIRDEVIYNYGQLTDKTIDKYYEDDVLGDFGKVAGKTAYSFGTGVFDGSAKGMYNLGAMLVGDKGVGTTYLNAGQQGISQNAEGLEKLLYDLAYQQGTMAPSQFAGLLGSVFGRAVMGTTIAGNAYAQAREEGYSYEQATSYAAVNATLEVTMESFLGGIDGLAAKGGLTKTILKNSSAAIESLAKNPRTAFVIGKVFDYLGRGVGEFTEEYLQEFLEPIYRNIIFDENNEINFFAPENFEAGFMGLLMASVSNGVSLSGNTIYLKQNGENIRLNGGLEGLVESGKESARGTMSNRLAEDIVRLQESGKPVSDWEISMLMEANKGAIADEEAASRYLDGRGSWGELSQEGKRALLNPDNIDFNNEKYGLEIPQGSNPSEIGQYLRERAAQNANSIENIFRDISEKTGLKIETFNEDSAVKGRISGNDIAVNTNMKAYLKDGETSISQQELNKRILKTVAVHEVTHALEENDGYSKLRDFVLKDLSDRGVLETVQEEIGRTYENEIEGLSETEAQNIIDSETVAKYVEDLFEDADAKTAEQRIRELYSKDKNVFQKIYDAIKNLVARVKGDSITQAEHLFEKVLNETKSENAQSNETRNAINARFENQYDNWAKKADKTTPIKNRSTRGYFVLGTTSKALQSIGIKDTPIIIDQSKIVKILNKHPEITDDIVKQIPQLLEEPILVMESKTDSGSVTVLGEVYGTNGVPVMAALKFKNVGQRNTLEDYSVVTSAYTKATKTGINKTQSLIDSSKLLYIEPNKNRTDTWLGSLGLQLPSSAITNYGSINKVSYSKGDVNIPGKIRQENTQYSKGKSVGEILDISKIIDDNDMGHRYAGHKVKGIANEIKIEPTSDTTVQFQQGTSAESLKSLSLQELDNDYSADSFIDTNLSQDKNTVNANIRQNNENDTKKFSITDKYSKGGSIEEILAGKNGENAAEYFKSKSNGAQKELLNFMPQAKSGGAALLRDFAKDVLASDTAAYKEAAALWVRYGERAKEAGKTVARINSSHILSESEIQAAQDISRGNRLNLAQYGSHAQTIEEYAQALKQERYIDEKTQSIFAKAFEEQRGRAKEVFDELYDNAFMEDSPEQIKIKEDIIKRLKSKMYVAPHIKAEFGDDYHPRMHGFNLTGNVNFNTQGNSVDSHYEDLSEVYPQYFPKDIINPADRLKKMTEVMDALKTPNLLKEVYGEEYKRAAQEEFASMLGSIKKAAQRAMSINEIDIPQNIKNSEYYKEPAVKYLENTIDYDALTSLEIKAKKQAVTNVLKSLEKMYGSFTQTEKAYAIKIAEGRMSADNLPDGIDRAAVLSYAEAYRIRFASELAETKRKALTDRALKKLKELKKVAREKGLSEADKSEIMRILGRYDYVSAFMSKQGELDTRRLAEEYRNILDEHPNAAITKGLEDKLNRLDKIRVSEMTADELYDLIQDVSAMEYSVRHMNDVLGVQQAEKITDAARQSIRAVEASKGFAPTTNRLFNAMRNQYGMNHLRPQTFFDQITGYSAEGGKLYEMLNEGTVRKAKFKGEATSLFDKFNSENKEFIEKMSGKDADWIEIEAGGKKYEITPAMRISLYLHSKNDANLRHFSEAISEVKGEDGKTHLQMLMGQGITIPNRKYYNKGMKSEAYLYGDTVKFTRAELAKIFEGMTAQEREFANLAHRYFNEVSKKAINETSMTLEGIETAQVDNYFPLQSDPNKLRQGKDVKAMQEALSNIDVTSKGFLKERKNARNAIILDDVTNILLNQIEAVSEYYGFAVAHRNFEAILAQVVSEKEGDVTVDTSTLEEVINKKWGKEATRYIEKLLQDNIGLNKSERSIWGALQGKFASAVLGLNPSVAIKQLSAYPTAGDVVGQKALVKGLLRDATLTPKQVRELDATIDKYTPMLAIRREGTGIREVGDVLKNNPQWAQKVPYLMQLPGLVDTAVVRKLWGACEYYVEDTLGIYKERLKNTDASDINELNVKSEVTENGQTGTETEPVTDSVGEGIQGEIRQRAGMGRLSRDEVLRGRDTIQRGQKGYEDFQKATEGTKITNKDGSPKIIYHGTNYDFDSFSNDNAGKNFEVKAGIFFTDNADVADLYSKLSKGNGERGIIPAAVKMMNPLVVNAKDIGWHRQRKLKETIDNANTIYGKQNGEELLKGYLSSRIKNERVLAQVLSAYENGKIDGIQIDDADWDSEKGKKNTQYIVFDAEQIVPAAAEYWGNKKYVPQDEYYRQVAKVFEQCIFRTQQNYTPMQQSQILRDTRTSTKLLTLFSSQNNQNYNVLYEAVGRYRAYKEKYGKGSAEFARAKAQLGRAVVSQILQGATFAGLGVFVKGFIKGAYDDKDEAAQDFFSQLISAFAGTVYGGQELYDLIMSAVNGEEWEGINVASFSTIKKLGQNIVDLVGAIADIDSSGFTNNNVLQAVRSVAKSIGGLFGVPAENAEAYIKDIVGRVTENASGGEFSFEEWYDGLFYNGTAARVKKASREKRDTAIDDAIYDGMNSVYGKSGGEEIKRLTQVFADEDGYNISDIYARNAPDRVTYNSRDYILTGSEKDRWLRTQNKAFGELNEFVKSEEYKALSDDEKFKAVSVFAKSAKAAADSELAKARKRELLASDNAEDRAQGKKIEISDEYTRLKESGGSLADYAVFEAKIYGGKADYSADKEGYSQKEKKEILFGMDIPEESKAAIYSAVFEDKNTKEEDSVLYAVKQGISAQTFVGFTSQEFEGEDKTGQKRKWLLDNCRDDKELQGMYERFMESEDTEEYKTIGYAAAQGVSPRKFVEFKQAVAEAKGSAGEAKTYSYWRNGKVVTEQYTGTESGSKAQEIYGELLGGGYSDKEIEVLYSMQFSDKIYPYAMEMGISPREYVKFKQAYANIPKGKGKKQRVFEAIESLKLSADKKMLLFCAQGYSLGTENKMRMFRYIDSLELSREQKMILADIMGFRVENGRVYVS